MHNRAAGSTVSDNITSSQRAGTVSHAHGSWITAVACSADGAQVVTGGSDGRICASDDAHTRVEFELGQDAWIRTVGISPDGAYIAAADAAGSMRVWRTSDSVVSLSELRSRPTHALAFSRNGRRLAVASDDGLVRVIDVNTGSVMMHGCHFRPVRAVAFSPSGDRLASVAIGGTAIVWDVETGESAGQIEACSGANCISFGSAEDCVVLLRRDDLLTWRLDGDVTSNRLDGPGPRWSSALSADGRRAATGDGAVARVYADDGRRLIEIFHGVPVRGVTFAADQSVLVTAGADGIATVWPLPCLQE